MLRVDDLHVRFGAIAALRGVSLHINQGEIVGLIGVNGAGKSTTIGSIIGIVRPSQGSISFENGSLLGLAPEAIIRRGIAPVMEGRRIFPALTVGENLRLGAAIRRDPAGIQEDLDRWCAFFPILGERYHQSAGNLSGGQQQMLAIGRALMSRPRLLLLDEPSLGLAPKLVAEVFALIGQLRELGMTMLLVEQNVRMTLNMVDRAYLLNTGAVEFTGTAAEMRQHADFERAYLGGAGAAAAATDAPR
ncbi:MAG: ABC transporter ATP-binding protein [Chloroflexia bacterium]|nr:ABC transporter ATP-binding protein [Chloroflexia bacterium]